MKKTAGHATVCLIVQSTPRDCASLHRNPRDVTTRVASTPITSGIDVSFWASTQPLKKQVARKYLASNSLRFLKSEPIARLMNMYWNREGPKSIGAVSRKLVSKKGDAKTSHAYFLPTAANT